MAKSRKLNDSHSAVTSPIVGPECFWVDMQPFLLHRGYRLRPRYDPSWAPPWRQVELGQPLLDMMCFEEHLAVSGGMIDAIRIIDGRKVVFKKVQTSDDELPIALFMSSKEMQSDPRNCAVPILDVILIPADDEHALLVMPHLLLSSELPFRRLGEFCEMARQLLEGLTLMHEQNIAHRDACWYNIMMDHSKMVPKGTHFCRPSSHDGIKSGLTWKSRWSVRPVQYYLIDFGISVRCPSKDTKVLGVLAQDKTVPELSTSVPYSPFPVDVYHLGKVFKRYIKDYDDLSIFAELAENITMEDPKVRPSASAAAQYCKQIVESAQNAGLMTRRIWRRDLPYSVPLTFSERLVVATGLYNPMY